MGSARRTNAASGCFRPLIRPCGIATPSPSPVDPRRSRANRLSVTVLRAMPFWFSKIRPACSKTRFLLVTARPRTTFSRGRYLAKRFMLTGGNVAWILLAVADGWRSMFDRCWRQRAAQTESAGLPLNDPDSNRNIIEQGGHGWCGAPSMKQRLPGGAAHAARAGCDRPDAQ